MESLRNNPYFYRLFLVAGIILQIYTFIYDHTSVISFISGCLGVIAVVLCSCKKYYQFIYAIPQLITYMYISFSEKLWGEVTINIFYFIMMVIALFTWRKGNYNTDTNEVEPKTLNIKQHIYAIIGTLLFTVTLYTILKATNDSQPFMDSITTGPAITAQILMTFRYKEQWLYWLIIDIASIIMWHNADDACMTMQYIFWTINCFYGYYMWNQKKINHV
ncbi:MAG: PnuC-like nicotinamide mononucleotide transport [Wendovervirus sonii]|uniref:PnuC-like nicotinamide mononucleotide transport n=1 Tax=phage Lak_Megaphage_Sonny TaxID=3109229 RepID=A0ABZ0Z5V2_9CAUD|nr:MAG: PnuC-like nicotinamide mononucleotide transport [phage Lak_Megaphage_Sonny]